VHVADPGVAEEALELVAALGVELPLGHLVDLLARLDDSQLDVLPRLFEVDLADWA
jgi:hypothetical protein